MIRAAKPVAKRTSPVTTKVPLKPQESAIHDPKSGATDLAPDRIEVSKCYNELFLHVLCGILDLLTFELLWAHQ